MVTLTTMMKDVHRLKKKRLSFTKANPDITTVELQPQDGVISQQEQPVTQGQTDYIGLSMNLPANARGPGGAGSLCYTVDLLVPVNGFLNQMGKSSSFPSRVLFLLGENLDYTSLEGRKQLLSIFLVRRHFFCLFMAHLKVLPFVRIHF